MKWKTVSMERHREKTGKAEIVGLALRASFKISMKEHVCMVYLLCFLTLLAVCLLSHFVFGTAVALEHVLLLRVFFFFSSYKKWR